VIGFTGTLLMKLPGPLNPAQEKQLQTVQSSARHLLSLINDLLDLAKIEAGKLELVREALDGKSVVEEVCTALRPLAERKGLRFMVTLPDAPLPLNTNRRALTQILINLADNAIKYTPQGEVRLNVRRLPERPGRIIFDIQDTGPGIRAQDQNKLFEAFARIASTEQSHLPGTCLGLHFSRKLAEILGGSISFHSVYGCGSTFTLELQEE
jgi:signal transduction histidine kinase